MIEKHIPPLPTFNIVDRHLGPTPDIDELTDEMIAQRQKHIDECSKCQAFLDEVISERQKHIDGCSECQAHVEELMAYLETIQNLEME